MRCRRSTAPAAGVLALLLLSGCGVFSQEERPAADPLPEGATVAADQVDGWETGNAAELGVRPGRLRALAQEAKALESSCLAVVRDGRLVHDWNWGKGRAEPREVFSVTKSVTSALVGIAVRDGSLRLDDRVARYVPEWRGTASRGVTVRNLLSNDSGRFWSLATDYLELGGADDRDEYAVGLGQQHDPGEVWAYNNAAIQVLDRVLSSATGVPTAELAEERLFEPLGMSHSRMTPDGSGRSTNVYFGLQTTCLDLARFARLYLDDGTVDGERLLARGFVRASVGRPSTDLNAGYGYLWWLNRRGLLRGATESVDDDGQPSGVRRGRLVPGAPAALFAAIGFGGQVAMVDPSSRTIVVRLGKAASEQEPYGLANTAEVVTRALR